MVSVFSSSEVDNGFKPRSGYTKDYDIAMCCFSAKHAAWERAKTGWLGIRWGGMSTRGLLFQWASTVLAYLSVLVYYKTDLMIISEKFLGWR
jgi:hypothetical protein